MSLVAGGYVVAATTQHDVDDCVEVGNVNDAVASHIACIVNNMLTVIQCQAYADRFVVAAIDGLNGFDGSTIVYVAS